jgi:seryl-tRNA synthetase
MLDIKKIRENPQLVKDVCKWKNIELDVDKIIELDKKLGFVKTQLDQTRSERNNNADAIKTSGSKPTEDAIRKGRELKEKIAKMETEVGALEDEFFALMARTPQIPVEDTPKGKDDSENVEVYKKGVIPQFSFKPKNHIELARMHDLIDFDRGTKVAGFRGYFLKNESVLMHVGLMMEGLKRMVANGYTVVVPPTVVREFNLFGTGHFPFAQTDVYRIENNSEDESGKIDKEKYYLAGTAEVGIAGMYSNETIESDKLPLKICGFSPCYRSEIGSHGRDMKGVYRIHEFLKIEQFIICENDYEISEKYHQELLGHSEKFLEDLGLPYRVIRQCTGDMGAGKYKMFDIETYMPCQESRNYYGETHSASNLGDWQARRLSIKYVGKDGKKQFVHTLNNTMVASPRILIAILENYQNEDGSITVPDLLVPYVGKKRIG